MLLTDQAHCIFVFVAKVLHADADTCTFDRWPLGLLGLNANSVAARHMPGGSPSQKVAGPGRCRTDCEAMEVLLKTCAVSEPMPQAEIQGSLERRLHSLKAAC